MLSIVGHLGGSVRRMWNSTWADPTKNPEVCRRVTDRDIVGLAVLAILFLAVSLGVGFSKASSLTKSCVLPLTVSASVISPVLCYILWNKRNTSLSG